MTRTDGILYTGISSQSLVRQREIKKERERTKQDKRSQLKPIGQLVIDELQKEIDKLTSIDYLEVEQMISNEHFKSEMMARKKTVERLKSVQTRLTNILREDAA